MHRIILAIAAVIAYFVVSQQHADGFLPLLFAAIGGGAYAGQNFLPGAAWSSGPRPANVVSFYKDAKFKGPRRDFQLGTIQNSLSKGFLSTGANKENDTYSSVQVPAGMRVLAYADNDLHGELRVYEAGDYPNLGDFNDKISSFKVVSSTDTTTSIPVVTFYQDKDFKGKQYMLYGPQDVMNLTAIPGIDSRDKMFSSVIISPGYRVWAYKEQNLGGTAATFQGSWKYLGDQWNDAIRSFKVIKD